MSDANMEPMWLFCGLIHRDEECADGDKYQQVCQELENDVMQYQWMRLEDMQPV